MSNLTLILGESGSGKSTSIRNLPPSETVIINVLGKPLPFPGWKSKYTSTSTDHKKANYFSSDKSPSICGAIKKINSDRPDVKYLILDDLGNVMANEFMRTARQKGFDKYNNMSANFFDILDELQNVRNDLNVVLIMHPQLKEDGTYKPRTQGKMFENHLTIECMFTYIFYAMVMEGEYKFLTNNDGVHMAKTPMGLFDKRYIENDLLEIFKRYEEYNNREKEETNDTAS